MLRDMKSWLAGLVIVIATLLAGCGPSLQAGRHPHIYGQPVPYETMYFVLTESGKEYYASEAELKLALQRHRSPGHEQPAPQ